MITGNAIGRIVRLRGMADDTGKPHMRDTHLPDFLQDGRGKVIELPTAVLLYRAVLLAGGVTVPVEPRKNLINNDLLSHNLWFCT
jgi:hypothetical protein